MAEGLKIKVVAAPDRHRRFRDRPPKTGFIQVGLKQELGSDTKQIGEQNEDRDSFLRDVTEQQSQGRESRGPHQEAARH
jgi:hypothetical protein